MKLFMTLMAILVFSSYAVAQDDPCADESGAGYGLCNAYCVAMNCDNPKLQEASAQACDKVAENYQKITGKTLLCGAMCPCYSVIDVNNFVTDSYYNIGIRCEDLMSNDITASVEGQYNHGTFGIDLLQIAGASCGDPNPAKCMACYVDLRGTSGDPANWSRINELTSDEVTACYNVLKTASCTWGP